MGFFDKIAKYINGTASKPEETKDTAVEAKAATENETETMADVSPASANRTEVQVQPGGSDGRYSSSISEQRYAWHKYLMRLLSDIKVTEPAVMRHFAIHIEKRDGMKYQWNDEAFKTELVQDMKSAGMSAIGKSSFVIDVVPQSVFRKLSGRKPADTEYFHHEGELLLMGSKTESDDQRFTTAIDKRAFVIDALLKKFRNSTGTDSRLMENLLIIVVRNEDDDDMSKYDWVGERFESDLRRALSDAFLDRIGSKSLKIELRPKPDGPDCISLIDNRIYYTWSKPEAAAELKKKDDVPYQRASAYISVVKGTGSLAQAVYELDTDSRTSWHIGRGVTARKGGKYRINDIVVKDTESNPDLMECNGHVSSAHADIIYKNNRFYLRAAIGGCRACGGSPTKLVRDEQAVELRDTSIVYPLADGDMLELGKKVLLLFSLSAPDTTAKPSPLQEIDDSF